MKKCSRCHQIKDEEYFQKDASKKDGLCSACKECEHLRYLARLDYNKNYYQKHRSYYRKKYLFWQTTHKDQFNAGWLLRHYKKLGKIIQKPCLVCGKLPSEAHHSDYSKPLQVIWLCKGHHGELRRKNGEHFWETLSRTSGIR